MWGRQRKLKEKKEASVLTNKWRGKPAEEKGGKRTKILGQNRIQKQGGKLPGGVVQEGGAGVKCCNLKKRPG